jgi:N-acetylneuraminic acid mutarotase
MRALRVAWVAVAMACMGCGHPLSVPRAYHTASTLPHGDVLVVGGDDSYPPHDRVGRYDPHRGRWRAAASLPVGLEGHTATSLLDGRVLVVGGYGSDVEDRTEALVYEPASDRWRAVAPMGFPRSYHTATRLADGRVLVAGGRVPMGAAEIYDPRRDAWSFIPDAATGGSATATLLRDGRVLVVGGTGACFVYDPREDHWQPTGPMLQSRDQHTTTLLPDGRVLVVGGRAYVEGSLSDQALDSTELYDPRRNRWTPGPRLQEARSSHTTTLVGGVLVIAGGMPSGWGGQRPLRSAELLDLARGRWSTREIGRSRADHTATALPGGRLLIVGGRTELIVSKWSLRWSRTLRLRGDLQRAARREPTGAIDPSLGAHGSRAPRSP